MVLQLEIAEHVLPKSGPPSLGIAGTNDIRCFYKKKRNQKKISLGISSEPYSWSLCIWLQWHFNPSVTLSFDVRILFMHLL